MVDPAAVIAGDAAEHDAQHQAQGHADEADGHGDSRAIDGAAEEIAAQPVGAQRYMGLL
jgi:hypothetical protein